MGRPPQLYGAANVSLVNTGLSSTLPTNCHCCVPAPNPSRVTAVEAVYSSMVRRRGAVRFPSGDMSCTLPPGAPLPTPQRHGGQAGSAAPSCATVTSLARAAGSGSRADSPTGDHRRCGRGRERRLQPEPHHPYETANSGDHSVRDSLCRCCTVLATGRDRGIPSPTRRNWPSTVGLDRSGHLLGRTVGEGEVHTDLVTDLQCLFEVHQHDVVSTRLR